MGDPMVCGTYTYGPLSPVTSPEIQIIGNTISFEANSSLEWLNWPGTTQISLQVGLSDYAAVTQTFTDHFSVDIGLNCELAILELGSLQDIIEAEVG
jgi:hypothetical protein